MKDRDDLPPLGRVEPVQRLVEEQQVRVVRERLRELHPLAHAVREAAHLAPGDITQPNGVERAGGGRIRIGDPVQARDELDHLPCRQEQPWRALVGDDADPLVDGRVPARLHAEDADGPRARRGEPGAELEGGRLPRAVVAEQPRDARPDRERHVGDRHRVAVPTRDAGELDRGNFAHPSSPRNRHTRTSAERRMRASHVMTHAVFDGSPASGTTG